MYAAPPRKHLPGPDPRGTNSSRDQMQTFRLGRVGRISMAWESEAFRQNLTPHWFMTKAERDYQAPITQCWHLSRGLSPLATLQHLQSLDLSLCLQLSGDLRSLAELKTLRSHDLSKNRDQHFVPRHFATLIPALKALPACNKFGSHGHRTEPRATARLLTGPSTSTYHMQMKVFINPHYLFGKMR
jgi:hypothetical protein